MKVLGSGALESDLRGGLGRRHKATTRKRQPDPNRRRGLATDRGWLLAIADVAGKSTRRATILVHFVMAMANRVSAALHQVPDFRIRRAPAQDAEGIVSVVKQIASERVYSAIEQPWSIEKQRAYLESLSAREAFHVAVDGSERVIGFQSLDLWSPLLSSMAHVGQLGTFLVTDWRRRGVGGALFQATHSFARSCGYRKLLIQVRVSNTAAQAFYQQLGFIPCGRLTRQVVIDGQEDDEILMEFFLCATDC